MTPKPHTFVATTAAIIAMIGIACSQPSQATAADVRVRVPQTVADQAQALCTWGRHRYPPLATGPTGRQLVMIYRATPTTHRKLNSTPAYFDCRSRVWRAPDIDTPADIVECTRAAGRCADRQTHGLVVRTEKPADGTDGCTAAVVLRPNPPSRNGVLRTKTTVIHEYVIHCGLRALGRQDCQHARTYLAERVDPTRISGWFGEAATSTRYREQAAKRRGFTGSLTLPTVTESPSSPDHCGPVFQSGAQRTGYLWYVEEAFAKLVSHELAAGNVTALAARGPEEALAARLAMNLEAFAAGIVTTPDVLRPLVEPDPPLLTCANANKRWIREAFIETPTGLKKLPSAPVLDVVALRAYIETLQTAVTTRWRRPTGVPKGLKCTVALKARQGRASPDGGTEGTQRQRRVRPIRRTSHPGRIATPASERPGTLGSRNHVSVQPAGLTNGTCSAQARLR